MKNFEKHQFESKAIILIIVFSFMFASLNPLFGQVKITPKDSVTESIKKTFPKIYETIVSEADLNYPNDSKGRNLAVRMQCYCFTLYWNLLSSYKHTMPEKELFSISINLLLENSKSSSSSRLWKELKENPKKFDSILSEMVVDWTTTFRELDLIIQHTNYIVNY